MGAPDACSYAALSILAHFQEFLFLLKRFIKNIFLIWIGNEET
jgi:hypothetical protein